MPGDSKGQLGTPEDFTGLLGSSWALLEDSQDSLGLLVTPGDSTSLLGIVK